MKKKLFNVLILILMINIIINTSVSAKEINNNDEVYMVALGDSISAGFMLEDVQNSFINKLRKRLDKNIIDYSETGDTTSDLLKKLNNEEIISDLKKAEVISLNIGGNNIQGPFKEALFKAVEQYKGMPYEEAESELGLSDISNIVDILTGENEINAKMVKDMNENVNSFKDEFNEALEIIRENNKDAKIILQTIYNPFYDVPGIDKMNDIAEEFINKMNETIEDQKNYENTSILDVNSVFKKYGTMSVTNILSIDTHPNVSGHNIIYLMYMNELSSLNPYDIVNNVSNASISDIYFNEYQVLNIQIKADDNYYLPTELTLNVGQDQWHFYVGKEKKEFTIKLRGSFYLDNTTIEGACSLVNDDTEEINKDSENVNDSEIIDLKPFKETNETEIVNNNENINKGVQTDDKSNVIKYTVTMTISLLIMCLSINKSKRKIVA